MRNLKTVNQQMGVPKPGGEDTGQITTQEGKLWPIKLCDMTQTFEKRLIKGAKKDVFKFSLGYLVRSLYLYLGMLPTQNM